MRYFLAGYSLMGPQRASRLRRGVGVQALLALVLRASQLLCLHLLHLVLWRKLGRRDRVIKVQDKNLESSASESECGMV